MWLFPGACAPGYRRRDLSDRAKIVQRDPRLAPAPRGHFGCSCNHFHPARDSVASERDPRRRGLMAEGAL
jgi:hypothetical protein